MNDNWWNNINGENSGDCGGSSVDIKACENIIVTGAPDDNNYSAWHIIA